MTKKHMTNSIKENQLGKKKYLITGGCGFIGSHIVEHLLKTSDCKVSIIDKLTYSSSGLDRLRDIKCFDDGRVTVYAADFTKPLSDGVRSEIGEVDYILHLGAETHVDNSIEHPEVFVQSNVVGTLNLLQYARTLKTLKRFLYFSTDEVFGPAPPGVAYKEWDRYNSGNPYAATKAGAEELVLAFSNTYGLPVVITHTMNVFGERQHPEKFIPNTIKKLLNYEPIIIHANKEKTQAGVRSYIHARNVAAAVDYILLHIDGLKAAKFNIVGEKEIDNLSLAQFIWKQLMGVGAIDPKREARYELVDFHSSRPGHDLRYALDGTKMKELGWTLPVDFDNSLKKTIHWSLANKKWLGL